jgi:hypothetical protein
MLSKFINSSYVVNTTKGEYFSVWPDFITGNIVVSDEGKAGLFNIMAVRKSLSSQNSVKLVTTIVRVMNIMDFNSVVCEIIIYHILKVIA